MKYLQKVLEDKIQEEEGSITFFVLFLFIFLFVFGGMAVDIARLESSRVDLQNTLDSALFAVEVNAGNSVTYTENGVVKTTKAGSESDQAIINDFFEKSGIVKGVQNADWGLSVSKTNSNPTAWAKLDSPNLFLSLYGFSKFDVIASAEVEQQFTDIEISLVVDISGSMAGTKMTNLRSAVADFATTMFSLPLVRTHISIIPFDWQTNAGPQLLTAFHSANSQNVAGETSVDDVFNMKHHCVSLDRGTYTPLTSEVTGGDYHSASLTKALDDASYTAGVDADGNAASVLNDTGAQLTNGERMIVPSATSSLIATAEFRDHKHTWLSGDDYGISDFNWRKETFETQTVRDQTTTMGKVTGDGYNDATSCRYTTGADNGDNGILPFATTIEQVTDYMAGLEPDHFTASDLGLKWGMALLDPSMRNTVKALVDGVPSVSNPANYLVPPQTVDVKFEGRPANYEDEKTLKILVHMSDGKNTMFTQPTAKYDNKNPTYDELSPVYYDENRGADSSYTYSVKRNGLNSYFCANGRNHMYTKEDGVTKERCRYNSIKDGKPHGYVAAKDGNPEIWPTRLSYNELLQHFTVPDILNHVLNTNIRGNNYPDWGETAADILDGDGAYANGAWQDNDLANARTQAICDVAHSKFDADRKNFMTFTIAFAVDSGSTAEQVLKDCVHGDTDRFFAPSAGDLGTTFESIAASITKLRLTN